MRRGIVRQITKFIREGRISLMDNPNMGVFVNAAGILIREGHLCGECRTRLTKQVQRVTEAMNQRESKNEAQREEHKPGTGYWIKRTRTKRRRILYDHLKIELGGKGFQVFVFCNHTKPALRQISRRNHVRTAITSSLLETLIVWNINIAGSVTDNINK